MGQHLRSLSDEEIEKRNRIRRSLHLTKTCVGGELIPDDGYRFMRPGDGLPPDQEHLLKTARLKCDMGEGSKLSLLDLSFK